MTTELLATIQFPVEVVVPNCQPAGSKYSYCVIGFPNAATVASNPFPKRILLKLRLCVVISQGAETISERLVL